MVCAMGRQILVQWMVPTFVYSTSRINLYQHKHIVNACALS